MHSITMKKLKIYYTSDVHGAFSPVDYATGSRIAAGLSNCIAGFKKDGDTLIIDGGDICRAARSHIIFTAKQSTAAKQ